MRTPLATLALVVLLAGCTGAPMPVPTETRTPTATPTPEASAAPLENLQPSGAATDILTGLQAPWSIVRLDNGTSFISERDNGAILEMLGGGAARVVGTVGGVAASGEGGLLGIESDGEWLYVYFTSSADNRVQRFALEGAPGSYSLGTAQDVITGIEKSSNHNGGRIKLGPDGDLYITAGDATNTDNAQNVGSLNGKILRVEPDGSIPADNPFPGSPVYSYGHRNPQGIAWDASGQLWAAEFGQDTWDELNRIVPGGNYGWPIVEGVGGDPAYTDPVLQWATDDASPSGLAYVRGTFFMAGLGGERLIAIYPAADGSATSTDYFVGEFGRIRDVVAGPDGSLWFVTNNTDGRGSPRAGDDRLVQVQLSPVG